MFTRIIVGSLLIALLALTTGEAGSRPSFGGGGRPSGLSGSSSRPSFGGSKPSGSSNRPSFGGGSNAQSRPTTTGVPRPSFGGSVPSPLRKSTTTTSRSDFDSTSSTAARKLESKQHVQKNTASAPIKTNGSNDNSAHATQVRNYVTDDRRQTRAVRVERTYATYYTQPMVLYSDPFHSYYHWWLLDRVTVDGVALWIYHHRTSIDSARLATMYAKNAELQAKVAALEAKGTPRDPNYIPDGTDVDLMYSDDYVNRTTTHSDTTTVLVWIGIVLAILLGCVWILKQAHDT